MAHRATTVTGLILGVWIFANCSSDKATPERPQPVGQFGETCQARRDCATDLACINQICVAGGGGGTVDAGDEVLGGLGESCTARSDCVRGLSCVNQVCASSQDKPEAGPSRPTGGRGESCASHVDCAAGLACVKNVCAPSDIGIDPSGKECVRVQCRAATDCCGLEGTCPARRRECQAGIEASCKAFQDICACASTDKWACTDNLCVAASPARPSCSVEAGALCSTVDSGFVFDGYCNGSQCVECLQQSHCVNKAICIGKLCNCVQEKCTPVCATDLECPGLQKCQNNKCVEGPCTTNRECVAFTGNPLSSCDQGKCRAPCTADADCSDPTFRTIQVCASGYCQDAGCETRDECKILLQKQGTLLTNLLDVECRAKK